MVDPLNAALFILKKEGHRFLQGQSDSHKVSRFSNCLLTPKGIAIMMEETRLTKIPDPWNGTFAGTC